MNLRKLIEFFILISIGGMVYNETIRQIKEREMLEVLKE